VAKRRTEKSAYESRYGGGWITASQRLAEMACERNAGPTTLSTEFWRYVPWVTIFRREATFASRLLQRFTFTAIVNAFESRDGRRVRSLGAPFFVQFVEREQQKLDYQQQQLDKISKPEVVDTMQTPRPMKRAGISMRQKLEEYGPQSKPEDE
jgi:hypothetical protein